MQRKILRPYQRDIVKYGRSVKHPRIFADMRLGKTLCTIRIVKSYPKLEKQKILIVAPFSAWNGWQTELSEEGISDVNLLEGSKKNRKDLLSDENTGWYLTNYEAWRSIGPELRDFDWDIIILDESDIIKNPKAKVTKFFTDNFRFVKHRFILTGTPDPEHDLNFFSQLKFSDENIFVERNIHQFIHNWCESIGYDTVIRPKYRDLFRKRVAQGSHFIKRSDVNLGGSQIIQKRFVRLDAKHQKMYATLENTFILESVDDGVFKSTTESFATYTWAKMLASGVVDGKQSWNGKLIELYTLMSSQLKGEKVVIWASFDAELYAIQKYLLSKNITCKVLNGKLSREERDEVKHSFQRGEFTALIAQPEIFKYGTDLSVASTIIYYSLPASAKTYRQSKDRTISIAKNNSCLIIFLLTEDTVDVDICNNLENKLSRSSMNHDIARGILSRVQQRRGSNAKITAY